MNIPTRISIHSRRRTEHGVAVLCLGVVLASFCAVVLPDLLQRANQADSHSRPLAANLMPWLVGTQIFLHLCWGYSRYLWARAAGILSVRTRDCWWLKVIPWFCLYAIATVVFWDFYQPISPLWFVLWIPPTVALFCSPGAGSAEMYDGGRLQAALTPAWPAGTPGAEPHETGSVVRELQIIVVRNITDIELIQLLATCLAVKSFREVPEAGFAAVLCDAYPRLKSVPPGFVQTEIEETEFEDIDLVINEWGWCSEWPWQGELDDCTVLVHNDGETRIVPPDRELFEQYRAALKQNGRGIGLDKFYQQTGGQTVVVRCAASVAEECGTGVPPV
jgi:hypothetical protein